MPKIKINDLPKAEISSSISDIDKHMSQIEDSIVHLANVVGQQETHLVEIDYKMETFENETKNALTKLKNYFFFVLGLDAVIFAYLLISNFIK